jgi:hypothetical protein
MRLDEYKKAFSGFTRFGWLFGRLNDGENGLSAGCFK